MTKQELLDDPNSCLNRSTDDEPVFLLCGRDVLAPDLVDEWAYRASCRGVRQAKTTDASVDAAAMRKWQTDHPDRVKVPD